MELDSYQHYFYDHDAQEDFHRSTAPSEDIWKKFELVPTPPLSPLGSPGEKGLCSGPEERPGWLSRYCLAGEEPEYLIGTGQIFGNLSAFILKDCMWSGFSARERLEKAMTEKLSTGTQRATPHKPSFAQDFGFSSSVSECVDPAAVFLCPLAESKIPASSGSEGQSDSGKGWSRSSAGSCRVPPALLSPAWGTRVSAHVCAGIPCPHMCVQGSSQPGCAFVEAPSEPRSRPHEQSGLGCPPFPRGFCSGCPCPSREGAWDSGGPFLSSLAHENLVGRLKNKFAAHCAKVWGFERCAALCRKFGCSPFFLPRPTRDGLPSGQKAKHALGAALWEQPRVPRGAGSVGRAGTAAPAVASPSPAPGPVCPSRVGDAGVFTRGVGLGHRYPQTPPGSLRSHSDFRCLCANTLRLSTSPQPPVGWVVSLAPGLP